MLTLVDVLRDLGAPPTNYGSYLPKMQHLVGWQSPGIGDQALIIAEIQAALREAGFNLFEQLEQPNRTQVRAQITCPLIDSKLGEGETSLAAWLDLYGKWRGL